MARLTHALDVLVVGAGQAGLALGYHLRTTPLRFQIVDRYARVGDSWRRRYDSLVLFTPRRYSALPGLAVPGDPDGYPSKDEIAAYLERYAAQFDLPVELGTGIRRLEPIDGGFRATTDDDETIACRAVVLASGAFQVPVIPAVARRLSPDVMQLTPETYRNPTQIPSGRVVVVGDGATGRQIARELAATHAVLLSTGRPRRVSPERLLGRSVFWWLDKLGVLRAARTSPVGRYLMNADPFPGKALELPHLRRQGIQVVGRLYEANGTTISFASGETAEVDTVVWATGYRDDGGWVVIPEAKDSDGGFIHQRGVSPVPGLYLIGRSWQWTRGSALLAGVGDDAAYLTGHIAEQLEEQPAALPRESHPASV
jgi:putative flavoprotein involved in K+ transport